VAACAGLFVSENIANLFGTKPGEYSPAVSNQHPLAGEPKTCD